MKIRPMGAELHADGQTDMTKLIAAFCNFAHFLINTHCGRCLPQRVFF